MTKEEAQAILGPAYEPGMELTYKHYPDVIILNPPPPLTPEEKQRLMSQTPEEREATWEEEMRIQNKLPLRSPEDQIK